MKENKELIIKKYLSNVQVQVELVGYTKCSKTWIDLDYVPGYSKFYYICEGEGWLKIRDKEFFPKEGQLFLMPEGARQSYSALEGREAFLKYWCHFRITVGNMNLFDILQVPYYIEIGNDLWLKNKFEELLCYYNGEGLSGKLKIKAVILDIIGYYLDRLKVEEIHFVNSSSVDRLNYIIEYIEKHLHEEITVEMLADLIHFHPNYFIKFFRNHMGSTPLQYINQLRLEKAKVLIHNEDLTIQEIADQTGFNSASYFSKIFKRYSGFAPQEFRERL